MGPPLRETKKNAPSTSTTPELTSSLRPRRGIVVYNERQLQSAASAARDERKISKPSIAAFLGANPKMQDNNNMNNNVSQSNNNGNNINTESKTCSATNNIDINSDASKTGVRKRSLEGNEIDCSTLCKPARRGRPPKYPRVDNDERARRSATRVSIEKSREASTASDASSKMSVDAENQSKKVEDIKATAEDVNSTNKRKNSDKFDLTMESVLHNLADDASSLVGNVLAKNASILHQNGHGAGGKPYVYRPRATKFADENGIFAAIMRNAQNSSVAPLFASYRPRNGTIRHFPATTTTCSSPLATTSAPFSSASLSAATTLTNALSSINGGGVAANASCINYASTSTCINTSTVGDMAFALAQSTTNSPLTFSSALHTSLGMVGDAAVGGNLNASSSSTLSLLASPTSVESSLSRLFGNNARYSAGANCATTPGESRRIVPNFTTSNPLLDTSLPATLAISDFFRSYTQCPLPAVMARISVDVRPLGKALFHDDPSWSRYTFPKRSLFGSEALVYFYRSLRWPDRKLVLVPYGKSVTSGEIPYTCGSCFKFSACLKHRFDLAPRNKIPVIIARRGQLLDDPDSPPIPHICDPLQLSDAEKTALAEYGELMAESRESRTPPRDAAMANDAGDVSRQGENCGSAVVSVETERRNLLIVVQRLTECCSKLMSVGFDFTTETMREKAFDIADEINLPRNCITDEWLLNVGRWLGVCDVDDSVSSAMLASAVFGDALAGVDFGDLGGLAARRMGGSDTAGAFDATFTNTNEYLKNIVSAAVSYREQLQRHDDERIDKGATAVECISDNNAATKLSDSELIDAINVLVKESCPIEFVFNGESGVVSIMENENAVESSTGGSDMDIKREMDMQTSASELSTNMMAVSQATISAAVNPKNKDSIQSKDNVASQNSGEPILTTVETTTNSDINDSFTNTISRPEKKQKDGNKNTRTSRSDGTPSPLIGGEDLPISEQKTLFAVIQESFTKTNFPELAKSLNTIRDHIMERDCSLLPMYNSFSARIAKMMYTTKPRNSSVSKSASPTDMACNGDAFGGGPTTIASKGSMDDMPAVIDKTNGEIAQIHVSSATTRQRYRPSSAELSAAFKDIRPLFEKAQNNGNNNKPLEERNNKPSNAATTIFGS